MSKQNEKAQAKELKILLLGDSGVGKTSIFQRYFEKKYKDNLSATVGVDFVTKEVKYKNDKYIIHIFDTAGQERFKSITSSYYNLSDYFFVVFDLTNENSLIAIPNWIQELKETKENPKYIILGNKDDLKNIQISDEKIKEVLDKLDIIKINNEQFIRVSAKSGKNIEKAFNTMIDLSNNNININENIENTSVKLITQNNLKQKKKMGCC